MKKKNILIIGASGFIGNSLFAYLKKKKINVFGTYRKNKKKNYIKFDTKSSKINKKYFEKFSHVIICQNSFKKLDEYQKNWKKAEKLDLYYLSKFLLKLKKYKIVPIYFSSDAVFNGSKGNYKEYEKVNPINKYGYIKVKMEKFIIKNFKNYMILRFSKLFSNNFKKKDFMNEMISNIKNNQFISYADDEFFSPIYIQDLNDCTYKLIKKEFIGIIHLSSIKKISRYRLALKIKSITNSKCKIKRAKINSLNFIAKRGKECTLNTDKYDKKFSFKKKKINYYLKKF